MRSPRIVCCLLVLLAAGISAGSIQAQDNANFEIGLKPYGSYHMGNIDNVSLGNGSLGVDIPLISYPQRGGELALNFALHYFNGSSYQVQACYSSQWGTECVWEPFGSYSGFAVIDTQAFMYGWPFGENSAVCSGTPDGLEYCNFQVSDSDGASHLLQPINAASTSYRTVDATGILGSGPSASITSLTDPKGIVHTNVQYGIPTDTREDANGNEISYSSTAGWIDTMGRTISAIPTPGSSGLSNCPEPPNVPLAPASASVWSAKGPNGGTYTITLCYAQFSYTHPYSGSTTVLQSLVLPNATAWNFTYAQSLGSFIPIADLSEITFPTGGTIAYTWTGTAPCTPGVGNTDYNEAVATRILNPNDGVTPASQWSYAFASTGTTVTDPASNASVHVFGVAGPPGTQDGCFLYENQVKYYQGSTSGSLLKTVNTTYSYTPLSGAYNYSPQMGPIGNVVPIEVDTIWPNQQQSTIKHSYDSGVATYYPYYTVPGGVLAGC
jgi:hypothetical protein